MENITISKRTFVISIICVVAVVSLIFNGIFVYVLTKNAQAYQQNQINVKILDFANMFTKEILLANKDVDFDTRLALETKVRSLNDKEIFDQWEKFTKSQTKEGATAEAKNLLALLMKRSYK